MSQQFPPVPVADDAQMMPPYPDLEWHLRYGDPVGRRYVAASAVESYRFLVMECTKQEAWRRIKLLRAALKTLGRE